jgi:hypothetical protein
LTRTFSKTYCSKFHNSNNSQNKVLIIIQSWVNLWRKCYISNIINTSIIMSRNYLWINFKKRTQLRVRHLLLLTHLLMMSSPNLFHQWGLLMVLLILLCHIATKTIKISRFRNMELISPIDRKLSKISIKIKYPKSVLTRIETISPTKWATSIKKWINSTSAREKRKSPSQWYLKAFRMKIVMNLIMQICS